MSKEEYAVDQNIPLRDVLLKHHHIDYPVSGGWGYSREDAIVVQGQAPFRIGEGVCNLASLEKQLTDFRVNEELWHQRPEKDRFGYFKWFFKEQQLIRDKERVYDCINIKVICTPLQNYQEIRQLTDENMFASRLFRESRTYKEYIWFDITDPYGKD